MQSIILFGYMCVGKTTIGRRLAQRLGRAFYDLDWYIEDRFYKRIPEIFAEKGEEGFRNIERRMLQEVACFEDIVLSCGGGTPCFFDNAEFANANGLTIYLKATPETIINHLALSRTDRPLLKGKTGEELTQFIETQLAEREPYYAKAQITVDVNVLDDFNKIDTVVDHIITTLNEHGKMEN